MNRQPDAYIIFDEDKQLEIGNASTLYEAEYARTQIEMQDPNSKISIKSRKGEIICPPTLPADPFSNRP